MFVSELRERVDSFRMSPLWMLLVLNVVVVSALLVLSNKGVLPFRLGDFLFFGVLLFLVALYRPGWVFGLLVGVLPLELVNVAPVELGFNLRPYQFLAVILGAAVLVRILTKRTPWKLFSFQWIDGVFLFFAATGLLVLPFLPEVGLFSGAVKQSVIVLSFVFLFFLGRTFFKTYDDIRIAGRFFILSTILVLLYAVWQSVRMKHGLPAFEVMTGRPNGTFPEADWLGGFVAAVAAFASAFLFPLFFAENFPKRKGIEMSVFLVLLFLVLLLSVSRSAWLAAFLGIAMVVLLSAVRFGAFRALMQREWGVSRRMLSGKLFLFGLFLAALCIVIGSSLSSFHLFDRGKSIGSGLQKITVSCLSAQTFSSHEAVDSARLVERGCRHINLEDIASEQMSGHVVTEAYRVDPNISLRKEIYRKTFTLLSEHAIVGIGWGNSSRYFGNDERGAGLNSSNMFLEAWLGAGVFGFLLLVIFWFAFGYRVCVEGVFLKRLNQSAPDESLWIGLSGAWVAITVFNLFNAGLLLGSLWVFLSLPWLVKKDI